MHTNRTKPAFTLIEVLVSVVIISTSIILVLKIHSQTVNEIKYITQRANYSFQDSIFINNDIEKYNKEQKNALDILTNKFHIDKLKTKKILQNIKRDINTISKTKHIQIDEGLETPPISIKEITLKNRFLSQYIHIMINSL